MVSGIGIIATPVNEEITVFLILPLKNFIF
jgi:hypothetical protein